MFLWLFWPLSPSKLKMPQVETFPPVLSDGHVCESPFVSRWRLFLLAMQGCISPMHLFPLRNPLCHRFEVSATSVKHLMSLVICFRGVKLFIQHVCANSGGCRYK